MNNNLLLITILLLASFLKSHTVKAQEQDKPRLIVHLLDYLAKDYRGAVSDSATVLSESEYNEQMEFAAIISARAAEIPELIADAALTADIARLKTAIDEHKAPDAVVPLARDLQQRVIKEAKIKISPSQWPDIKAAAQLYQQACALCHGPAGAGDGPAGINLDPKPANFLDEGMAQLSPLAAYNTIRMGVPGTGMMSFAHLSEAQSWGLAFYLVSLRHATYSGTGPVDLSLLEKAATSSDETLLPLLNGDRDMLSRVRTHSPDLKEGLSFAIDRIQAATAAAEQGNWQDAEHQLLKSYLEGVEPSEAKLSAVSKKSLEDLENAFSEARSAVSKKDLEYARESFKSAEVQTKLAQDLLSGTNVDARLGFVASVGILAREGFEAALIILALLSITQAAGSRRATAYVHAGWIAAILCGVACWFLLGFAFDISGAQRELMEGITSLVAVAVLLYLGLWLHQHSKIKVWTAFLKQRMESMAKSRNMIGFASISFLAVFREALETVLFLRVMWFDADQGGKTAILSGIVLTLGAILIACWAVLKAEMRLPVAKVFKASSYIAVLLAVILAGKGVRALQESGVIPEHLLKGIGSFDLLGFFPTTETILAQALTLVLMLFFLWKGNAESRTA